MDAKEYLSQTFLLKERLEAKMEQIKELKEIQFSYGGLKEVKVQESRDIHKNQDISAIVMDLTDEYALEITNLLLLKYNITRLVEKVPESTVRLVLELRYLNNLKWWDISERMCYSSMQINRIHNKGISYLNKILQEGTINLCL